VVNAQPIELLTIAQEQKFNATDASIGAMFGNSIDMDNDVAIIGANGVAVDGVQVGAAYIYRFDGKQWIEEASLSASGEPERNGYGRTVAISGDFAVVGANRNSDIAPSSGAVYVYRFDGRKWSEEAKLTASDAAAQRTFGTWVAMRDSTLFVSGGTVDVGGTVVSGVYVFRYDGKQWIEEAILRPLDGQEEDAFGASVAVSGDWAIIGAPAHATEGFRLGAAYWFQRIDGFWVEMQRFIPDRFARFGWSVSIDGGAAVVGKPGPSFSDDSGSAYVFRFDGADWIHSDTLFLPVGGRKGDDFGQSVSIDNGLIAVGVFDDAKNYESGSAYVFENSDEEWVLRAKLIDSDDGVEYRDDFFGSAVAISARKALVGSPRNGPQSFQPGAVYAFDLDPLPCPQDVDRDGQLDVFDVFALLEAFASQDLTADWNRSSSFTANDIFEFLEDFSQGCP